MTLRSKIDILVIFIIIAFSAASSALLYFVIKKDVVGKAQHQVKTSVKTAKTVYENQQKIIKTAFDAAEPDINIENLKRNAGLDYAGMLYPGRMESSGSPVIRDVLRGENALGGIRIIPFGELPGNEKFAIEIRETPMARPSSLRVLKDVMSFEYAKPFIGEDGEIIKILYGGRIINKNIAIIDDIADAVFENEMYDGKPVGTVTIFQDDVRIATNVLDKQNRRAIGTRVSEKVYRKVIEEGKPWIDRAFVVTHWYLTAYEPIYDVEGKRAGILYVGVLEKPFTDKQREIFTVLALIIAAITLAAIAFSFALTSSITKPLTEMLSAIKKMAHGHNGSTIDASGSVREMDELADSFNDMSVKLKNREQSLQASNAKLAELNKNYLDLVGFVSHELKGVLSSTTLNAYAMRDGFLGMINFKQRKSMDSVVRNLDYLDSTVKNFLNLSTIEKGELKINKQHILLKEDVLNDAVESFAKAAAEKEISMENLAEIDIQVEADPDLLKIVANNLVNNAVKYGSAGGRITVNTFSKNGGIIVEVYNDGHPLSQDQIDMLFKKFSRVRIPLTRKVKGTGLGLFISKEIMERHGGRIWAESRPNGNSFLFLLRGSGDCNG